MLTTEDDDEVADTEATDEAGRYNYRVMLQRDKRRWARADSDSDGELSKEEFSAFLHPEETDSMKDIIIDVWFSFYFTAVFIGCIALLCTFSAFICLSLAHTHTPI